MLNPDDQQRAATARTDQPPAAALLAIASVAAGLLNYGYTLFLSYRLAPRDYSIFIGAQSLILMVGVVGSVGIPYVVAQEARAAHISGDRQRLNDAIVFAFWANLALGAVTGGGVMLLVSRFGSVPDAVLTGLTVLVLACGSTGLGVLQGHGRTSVIASIVLGEVVVKLGVGIGFVLAVDAHAQSALWGLLLGSAVVLCTAPSFRHALAWPRFPRRHLALLGPAAQIGGLQIGVGVVGVLDTLLAASAGGPAESAASYQVASTLGKSALFISSAVSLAVFPLLSGTASGSRSETHNDLRHRAAALRTFLLAGGYVCIALMTVPRQLVVDVFSDQYTDIYRFLPLTAGLGFLLGATNIVTTFVQAHSRAGNRGRWRGPALAVPVIAISLTAMIVGEHADGVVGLAFGALVGAGSGLVVYCVLTPERRALATLGRSIVHRPAQLVWIPAVVVPLGVSSRTLYAWLPVTIVLGLCVLPAAFPEVRALLLRRSDRGGAGA